MNACSSEEGRILDWIRNKSVPRRKRQSQQEILWLLAESITEDCECKKLQVRCGGTPGLHPDVAAIKEGEVTGFRNAPDFDLVFFTFAIGQQPGPDMVKLFQYCRMLLKPGGTLALLLPDDKVQPGDYFFPAFTQAILAKGQKSIPVALLRRAGLVKAQYRKRRKFGVIVTGNRPVPYSKP